MTEELDVLRVVVVCPRHPDEVLRTWRAFTLDAETVARVTATLGRPAAPWIVTQSAGGETMRYLVPADAWEDADQRAGSVTPAEGRPGTDEHLQIRLTCPRPSCPVDARFTGDTRAKLRAYVAGLWLMGHRGEVRRSTTELGV